MEKILYRIMFYDYWHVGSGLIDGASIDQSVLKDNNRLPFIPGKTLKGLLREAAETLHSIDESLVSANFIVDVFGEKLEESKPHGIEAPKIAKAFFSDAVLSNSVTKFLLEGIDEGDENKKEADRRISTLYHTIASTKIDELGQAEDFSLRNSEVCIPLELFAEVIDFPNDLTYKNQLENCLKFIKRLGWKRNRGLGRCKLELLKV